MNASKAIPQDGRRMFLKKGTCSHTFAYLLDREFGHTKENEERATDLLAGGIMQQGHQCGMLWGATLAVGAESFRRHNDHGQAIASAITATQHVVQSFSRRTGTISCREITGCDLTSKLGMAKIMLKTILCGFVFSPCFNLAQRWAPEALQSATEGLSREQADSPQRSMNCASEVAKKMGASDEEAVMVAGFAGGLGLTGSACGALGAAIWMNALTWCREHPGKALPYFNNPSVKTTFDAFAGVVGADLRCSEVSGRRFETIDEHTEFIKSGGCETLIEALARA